MFITFARIKFSPYICNAIEWQREQVLLKTYPKGNKIEASANVIATVAGVSLFMAIPNSFLARIVCMELAAIWHKGKVLQISVLGDA